MGRFEAATAARVSLIPCLPKRTSVSDQASMIAAVPGTPGADTLQGRQEPLTRGKQDRTIKATRRCWISRDFLPSKSPTTLPKRAATARTRRPDATSPGTLQTSPQRAKQRHAGAPPFGLATGRYTSSNTEIGSRGHISNAKVVPKVDLEKYSRVNLKSLYSRALSIVKR